MFNSKSVGFSKSASKKPHLSVGYAMPLFDRAINYVKIEGGALRLHDFGHGVVGQLRANYQVIPKDDVPYADQFTIGGLASVRGYSEGLLIGRSGYVVSGELLFPLAPRTRVDKKTNEVKNFIGNYVKGFIFCDHGMVFPYKGTGFGARINLPGDLSLRLAWGIPLMRNKFETPPTCGRFHFELSLSPDIDALVKLRKPKNTENL